MSKRKGFDSKLGSVLGSSPAKPTTPKPSTKTTPTSKATKATTSAEKKASTVRTKKSSSAPKKTAKPAETPRPVGRPKATHNRIRFTSIVEETLRDKMKIIAIKRGIKINDAFNTALENYVNAFEKQNGEINLGK